MSNPNQPAAKRQRLEEVPGTPPRRNNKTKTYDNANLEDLVKFKMELLNNYRTDQPIWLDAFLNKLYGFINVLSAGSVFLTGSAALVLSGLIYNQNISKLLAPNDLDIIFIMPVPTFGNFQIGRAHV